MLTLLDVLQRTERFFKQRGIPSAKLDAQLLLANLLGMDRLQLFLQFDRPMTDAELVPLREPVQRRGRGEPMAWILGQQEFWSLDFKVGPGVLVPRPDTETLVEAALELLPEGEELFVADVCAGSGCVGLALASERPDIKVYATELSEQALGFLKQNVNAHGMGKRVAALRGDLLAPVPPSRVIDVVVSNPPYISTQELAGLEVAKHEPHQALDGGADGLDIYRRLIPMAAKRARVAVLMEIGHEQGEAVKALFEQAGLSEVALRQDLAGRDRVVVGKVVVVDKVAPGA